MKKYWTKNKKNKYLLTLFCALLLTFGGYLYYAYHYQVMPQAAIYFLKDVQMPQKSQKVLVFAVHSDDETIAAGGYIYEATQAGAQVRIVLVTDGDKRHLKETRYEEFKKAAGILGVGEENLVFLGRPDGQLQTIDKNDLKNQFLAEIEKFSPDIIIFPSGSDLHPDHATTGKIIGEILSQKESNRTAYQYLVHHRRFPQPKKQALNLYLLPPIKMVRFDQEWQRLMLTPEAENKKQEAIKVYQSQLRVPLLRSLILSSVRKNELFLHD